MGVSRGLWGSGVWEPTHTGAMTQSDAYVGGGWFLSCIERTLGQSTEKLYTDNKLQAVSYTMHGIIRTIMHYVLSATRFFILHVWLPQVIDDMIFTPIMDWLETDHHVVNGELPDDNNTEIIEGGGGAGV